LFKVDDAKLMSANAKQTILFDMSDTSKWYNESVSNVNIPPYQ